LNYLYSPEAQELAAKNFYRPTDAKITAEYKNTFPKLKLFTIADLGGWKSADDKHFSDGGIFDQLYSGK